MRIINRTYLPFEELAEGELQKKINRELKNIFNNIHDEQTDPTTARTITVKVKFTPDTDRKEVSVEGNITTKLANVTGTSSTILTGRDKNTGIIQARELRSGIPGQTYIDDDAQLRTDTGELIDQNINKH